MGFGDDCVRFHGIEKEKFQLAHIMLVKRGDGTSKEQQASWEFFFI